MREFGGAGGGGVGGVIISLLSFFDVSSSSSGPAQIQIFRFFSSLVILCMKRGMFEWVAVFVLRESYV